MTQTTSPLNLEATRTNRLRSLPFGLSRTAVLLAAILLLAAGLRLVNAAAIGDGNTYYTAAVQNMLQSPSNFFFVAADAGSVSVDKPPVALWTQAVFAAVFGVSGLVVTLPSIIAGTASVGVLYHLVKKQFGTAAGLIAAFVLAVTPVSVAVDRSNDLDSILIFTLLLAAWAFMRAAQKARWWSLLLGAALIGVGFNVKMMQAYLVLPAFFLFYLLSAPASWRRKVMQLGTALALILLVSFSWMLIVDLTPADQRPYVGSSQSNSAVELALGYNGLQRLLGAVLPGQPPSGGTPGAMAGSVGSGPLGSAPGGLDETGQPGLLRLFTSPLDNELGWLLPFGLVSVALLVVRRRVCLPLSREHQAVVLWGGWLLTGVVYFSISAFFHAYYLATLAPALAALTGIGIVQLWQLAENRRRMAVLVLGLVTLGTVIFQLAIIQQSGVPLTLWMIGVGLFILAGAGAAVRWLRGGSVSWKMATWGALVMALLLIPSAWGAATAMDPQQNPTLPAAFTGPASTSDGAAAAVPGGMMPAPGNAAVIPVEMMDRLVSYLQSHATGETYLIAVPNSMIGAKLALETGLPVMYMNGFNGSDSIQTADSIAELVADGQLRFIAPVSHSDSDQTGITAWVETNCSLVEDSQIRVAAPGMGGSGMPQPPNGKNGTLPASMPGMVGGISTALYDCAPAAAPEG